MNKEDDIAINLDKFIPNGTFIMFILLAFIAGVLISYYFTRSADASKDSHSRVLIETFLNTHIYCISRVCIHENMTIVDLRNLYNSYSTYPGINQMATEAHKQLCAGIN